MTAVLGTPTAVTPEASIRWCPVPPPYGPREQSEAGRQAAAAALAAAGSAVRAVPRATGGRPDFPRGYPGSIAHTDRMAVAAVVPGAAGVGVDIEDAAVTERMARFVLNDRERRTLLAPAGRHSPVELFSAKEAAFKALAGTVVADGLLFWRIGLVRSDAGLVASFGGLSMPVWVCSEAGSSFALAVRRYGTEEPEGNGRSTADGGSGEQ
ncbi:4'-phosphopantetheinyl transferase superfamily protein [Micromonospora sp. CP22]|uniref:4'-phosphopantetheinyl transferase superfamily protein n=1 Tax=Micromonospora sp. CP22 TaxID=2580517 RepID=UPI0012BBD3D1|nr:4'-phosphopantetheinyl transferase superfamily protein [Micromonospora sp. CP22]MTK05097.1 4'-phosphopantetheinyl transferase superfamily protein [Micromonospora sp. CP22]